MKHHSKLAAEVIDRRHATYGINDTVPYAPALGFAADPVAHHECGHARHRRADCNCAAGRIKSMQIRFSAPFLPNDTLRTEIPNEDGEIFFRSTSLERGTVALNNGRIKLRA